MKPLLSSLIALVFIHCSLAQSNLLYLDSMVIEQYDIGNSQWNNYQKMAMEYDSANNAELTYYYDWSGGSGWEYDSKVEQSYDGSGNDTLVLSSDYNSGSSQWENDRKRERDFNAQNNIVHEKSLRWISAQQQWRNNDRHIVSYDANGNTEIDRGYNWNASVNDWVQSSYTEYQHDANGNREERILYLDSTKQDSVWKDEYSYFPSGHVMERVHLFNPSGSGPFINARKTEYQYDSLDNILQATTYSWDTTTAAWNTTSRIDYNYDYNYDYNDLVGFINTTDRKNRIVDFTISSWDDAGGQWNPSLKYTLYYNSLGPVSLSEILELTAELYPNPTTGVVKVNLPDPNKEASIELFSIKGKKLLHQEITSDSDVDLSGIPSGIYSVRITQNGGVFQQKLVIQ